MRIVNNASSDGQSTFPFKLSDSFKLNKNFQSRVQKIVLSEPLALKEFQELTITAEVKQVRAQVMRAAVMHVMKGRRECVHSELVTEIDSYVTSFQPSARALRTALTHLIDLNYIRRDEQNPKKYVYCPDDTLQH